MDPEDELERLYSVWMAGYPPALDEVMSAIGEFLEAS
jgi:hypothetical protein